MRLRPQSLIAGIIIFVALAIASGYAYLKTKDYVAGPQVDIHSPENGSTVYKSLVEIVGVANNISFISLNDRPIFIDEHGAFKEKLLLYPGYNIMSIKAEDRFKRTVEKKLEVILLEQ